LRNFTDFACYVTMFPQLVAGPIIRFSEVAEQMRQRTHTLEKFARGIAFIAMGLAKKILIANTCGKLADVAFGAGSIGFVDAWYGVVSYAFQIYFDFSAYSDMAIGLGLLLGFVFPKNFDSPYHAQSITEFWRRWHISLSSWLRDYLYIPLGGSRKGALRTYVNLALVMLLGGLWHGASWNFVIWGGIHGTLLGVERAQGKDSLYRRLPAAVRVAITFLIVCIAWVFFRATDLPDALAYLGSMFGVTSPAETAPLLSGLLYKPCYVATFAVAAAITWGAPQTWDWTRALPWWKIALIMVLFACSILVLATQSYNPFIYFIF
jgi:alginate O-acetyltransferase complex protein AlgI